MKRNVFLLILCLIFAAVAVFFRISDHNYPAGI